MDDSKVDEWGIYSKYKATGEYLRENKPQWGELFLEVETVAELRAMFAYNQFLIKIGYYKGVRLNGYYSKGDTPKPIEYIMSNSALPDDGGSIFNLTGFKIESSFITSIHTAYFGLIVGNSKTAAENKEIIQNTFLAALRYNCKDVYLSEGIFEIVGGGINYDVPFSSLYFLGELRLADNSNSGEVQFIRYRANNITIYTQKYDGNRNNNTFNTQAGTQCNFATYGVENITFLGGYSKNSLQSHIHSTAENLVIDNMLFDTSGEHGLYLTLGVDQPKNKVTLRNCIIRNWGVGHAGAGLSVRDYRNALIERCIFDPTDSIKPASVPIINSYINYRSDLPDNETLKHVFKDCVFKNGGSVTNGVRCLTVAEKGITVEQMNEKGNGVYLQGGVLEYPAVEGVVEMRNVLIKPKGNPLNFNKFPRNLINCVVENILYARPQSPVVCNIEGNQFRDVDNTVINGILFDFNAEGVLVGGTYSFKNNIFIGFTSSQGIIRNTTNNNTVIVDSNKLKDCLNAVLVYSGDSITNTIINNSDITKSGVRLRFTPTATPRLVGNNDFVQLRGTTAQRPSGTALYVGLTYDNVTTGQIEIYNGTTWTNRTPVATTTIKGTVNQTPQQSNSVATDVSALVSDFNSLLTKLRSAGIISNI
ncbi:head fiber protein [Sphingobacterium paramultivorum]|uniref:head fiber protein n=1 Tax=Sphingobacterium paramultivorum TaxID=2886510 RepID=UPI001D0DBC51|nr:head fiber protein [Sphingobacterium paramultivorum]